MLQDAPANDRSSPGSSHPRMPAYWIFIPALLSSAGLVWWAHKYAYGYSVLNEIGWTGFAIGVGGLLSRVLEKTVVALIFAVAVIGCYWVPPLALCVMIVTHSPRSLVLAFFLVETAVPALTIAIAATISINRRAGWDWASSALAVGFVCSFSFLAAMEPKPAPRPSYAPGPDLGPAFILIDKCSQQFAVSHKQSGYPNSLEQIGPGGTGCIPEGLSHAVDQGVHINYEAGTKDDSGKILTYTMEAHRSSPGGDATGAIYSDESGIIWVRVDLPQVRGAPQLYQSSQYISPEYELNPVLTSLRDAASQTEWKIGDRSGERTVTDRDELLTLRLKASNLSPNENREIITHFYDMKYQFDVRNDGSAVSYALNVRPLQYGATAIRSYLAVGAVEKGGTHSTLNVFATAEDRPATMSDSLALAQEIGMSSESGLATWKR